MDACLRKASAEWRIKMRLTIEEQIKDFNILEEKVGRLDLETQIFKKDEEDDQLGFLVIFDDESQYAEEVNEESEEPLQCAIVSYMFEIDDEEDQLNKYILSYSEINGTYNHIDELELYRFLNEFNQRIPIGFFYPEKNEDGEVKVSFKHTMHSQMGKPIDHTAYCEMIIQAIFYIGVITDELYNL